jgi:polysaccharide lyase-like protein
MKKMQSNLVTLKAGLLTLAVGLLMTGCKKATIDTNDQQQQETSDATAHTEAINSTFSVNWNGYADGTYTSAQAAADFGNISGWNDSRTWISNGNCRIKLLANALSGAGGVIGNIDVSDGSAYELDYDVRFHSQFDFSRGGKIGFGFLVGDGNTGGDPGWDGNGGSLRLMWYQTDAGRVFFQPYIYYKDQPGEYGDTFGKSYPSSGSLNKGQTYHVHVYIKSNTGSNTDGRAEIVIDGTTVLNQAIRWTTNDAKRLIKQVSFHTFRGGSQTYWQSSTDGYIYYDNLSVHKISS